MGTNFGFIYNYNFNTKYGIAAGFYQSGLSFRTLNYDYGLQDSIYTALKTIPDYCFKCRIFVMHANTFPIRFIYRKELNRKIDINMQVGLDIQLQPSFYYRNQILGVEIGNDSSYFDMFIIKLENKGTKNFNVVPYFGFSIGINQFLKNNKHYLNYQFSGHIPFYNPYTNGSFNILPNTQYQATGTFKLNPMSFGLEVNYVFTFRKRKLRKGI